MTTKVEVDPMDLFTLLRYVYSRGDLIPPIRTADRCAVALYGHELWADAGEVLEREKTVQAECKEKI